MSLVHWDGYGWIYSTSKVYNVMKWIAKLGINTVRNPIVSCKQYCYTVKKYLCSNLVIFSVERKMRDMFTLRKISDLKIYVVFWLLHWRLALYVWRVNLLFWERWTWMLVLINETGHQLGFCNKVCRILKNEIVFYLDDISLLLLNTFCFHWDTNQWTDNEVNSDIMMN